MLHARVDNLGNPDKPELENYGEVALKMANGVSYICRVDWFTPNEIRFFYWGGNGRVIGQMNADNIVAFKKKGLIKDEDIKKKD